MQNRDSHERNAPNAALDQNPFGGEETERGGGGEGHHEDDLRITVRRLELPVRPRGVLAE